MASQRSLMMRTQSAVAPQTANTAATTAPAPPINHHHMDPSGPYGSSCALCDHERLMARRRSKSKHDSMPARPREDSLANGPRRVWIPAVVVVVAVAGWALYSTSTVVAPEGESDSAPKLLIAGSPDYVDGAVCAGCHAEIAATYAETGMGRSFYRVTPETMAHLGDERSFRHERSGREYVIREEDGRYYLRREEIGGGADFEKEIHYVMGSGNNARTYLHQYPSGKVVELPLGWYSENGGRLAMSPAFDQPIHGGFRREIGFECMGCHNGYPRIEPGADAPGRDPLFPGRVGRGYRLSAVSRPR